MNLFLSLGFTPTLYLVSNLPKPAASFLPSESKSVSITTSLLGREPAGKHDFET